MDGVYPDISPVKQYMVASESDLEAMGDGDDGKPHYVKGMSYDRIQKVNAARATLIQELYQTSCKLDRVFDYARYQPKHPHLLTLTEELFVPSYLQALQDYKATNDVNKLYSILTKEAETGIYSFQIFSETFCKYVSQARVLRKV